MPIFWGERASLSVANLTRADEPEFLPLAREAGVRTEHTPYPLQDANAALDDLRAQASGRGGVGAVTVWAGR